MRAQNTLRVFIVLATTATLVSLGGCGIAGTGDKDNSTFKIGNVSYLKDWDGSFVLGDSTVRGTGTIVASSAIASATASVGFRLEARVPDEVGASVELIAFAEKNGRGLTDGTRVQWSRDERGFPFLKIIDKEGVISQTPYPILNDTLNLVIDIHEGGSEVFVWSGDTEHFEETNTVTDTNSYHQHTPVRSLGMRWGVKLNGATLQSATALTRPHLEHNH